MIKESRKYSIADIDRMVEMLRIIGRSGCHNVFHKHGDFSNHCAIIGRKLGAYYGADKWCDACTANSALASIGESP